MARTLNEREIFQEKRDFQPSRLDLGKFFEKVNEYVETQSAFTNDSENDEDWEYHPWKKEDIEKLTSLSMNDETSEAQGECK